MGCACRAGEEGCVVHAHVSQLSSKSLRASSNKLVGVASNF